MVGPSTQYHEKDGPAGDGDRARTDRSDGDRGDETGGASGIHESAAWNLTDQRHKSANGQHKTDVALAPTLRRQIHGDKGSEPRLNIGQEEVEPIEAAHAAARGRLCRR